MAEEAHIAGRQSLSAEEQSGVPLGATVGIALGSALVIFLILGFGLIWLGKRRAAQRRNSFQARGVVLEEDVDEERVGSPNKLRKRDMSENMMVERSPSPIQRIPLPVLPPITSRRTSFNNFFGSLGVGSKKIAGGDPGSSPRRRNSNWIDEDAIHGPKVKKYKDNSGKKLARDSWPLKAIMPTLPKLHHHTESHHSQQGEQLFVEAVVVRNLPQPPRSHSGATQQQGGQASPPRLGNYYEDGTRDGNQRRPSTARGRQSSTDSTLSQILAKTEMRLEQGTMTGVARRNRATASPVKRWNTGTSKSMESIGDRSRTPSPTKSGKSQPLTPYHASGRKASTSSDISEPESLFNDAGDADAIRGMTTGLTSPSRSTSRQEHRSRTSSPSSSISSSLSTVYSEDEISNIGNVTQIISHHPSTSLSDVNQTAAASDPFSAEVSNPATRHKTTCSPQKGLRVGNARVASVGPPKLVLNRPPKLRSPEQRDAGMPLSSISPNGSPRPKSFGGQSFKQSSSEKINVTSTRHRTGIFPAPVLRPVSPISSDEDKAATPPKPNVVITSPSTLNSTQSMFRSSMHSDRDLDSPSLGRIRVVPPPLDLRVENLDRTWSPTLGFEEDDYVSIVTPSPMPSPGIPSPSQCPIPVQDSPAETRGHKGNRVLSTASSIYSQYTDVTHLEKAIHEYQPTHPPLPEAIVTPAGSAYGEKNTVMVIKRPVVSSQLSVHKSKRSSLLLSEQTASAADVNRKFLMTGAIAELRRMNSQVSAHSNSSSQPSTTTNNGPTSPTLPQLRGGGFSPSTRPVGSRHYLSLGEVAASSEKKDVVPQNPQQLSSPPQSSPSTVVAPRGCAMSIWGGCEDRQSSCSPPAQAQPPSDEDMDDHLMQLKMPKLDFDRFSGSFRAAVSERFINDLGSLEKPDSRQETAETPSRFPVGYQRNMHARTANLAMEGADVSPDRRSIDSLGLYDQDGFLIASPDRARIPASGRIRGLRI